MEASEKDLFLTFYSAQYFQVLGLGELCFSGNKTNMFNDNKNMILILIFLSGQKK